MLTTAILLFCIAALFGALILRAILKNKRTPKPVVIIHGVVASVGLLAIATYMIVNGSSALLTTSVVLFVLAALGGFTMLYIDMQKKPIPKLIAIVHPLIALAGLALLIVYASK